MGLNHLACIMDGNRRWAKKQGLLPWLGHKNGLDAIERVINFCLHKKIPYLSLYTFSIENLQRSHQEQSYLFEVLARQAFQRIQEFKDRGVAYSFIGDRTLFPSSVRSLCENIENETKDGMALQVYFFFCYGGQQEIVDSTKRIALEVFQGILQPSDITATLFKQFLWTKNNCPPDLIIRTGKQQRLSNFLLFQCAYSELYFLDCMWPDITIQELEKALIYYDKCQRNFGK